MILLVLAIVGLYLAGGLLYGASRIRAHQFMYPTRAIKAKMLVVWAIVWLPLAILWAIQHRGRP